MEPAFLAGIVNPGEDVRPNLNLRIEKRNLFFEVSCHEVQKADRDHRRPKIHGKAIHRTGLTRRDEVQEMPRGKPLIKNSFYIVVMFSQ